MPTALAAALLLAAFHGWPATAHACKCGQQTQAEAAQAASAIFEGRVESIATAAQEASSGVPAPLLVQLAVVRRFKGANSERAEVRTNADGIACGYEFQPNESYLVYAESHDGKLWVSRCGRTQPMAAAEADLSALGMGTTPVDVKNPVEPEPAAEPEDATDCSITGPSATRSGWALAVVVGALAVRRLTPWRRSRSRS